MRVVAIVVLGSLLACSGGFDNAVNVPPLEQYSDALVTASQAPVTRGTCGMFGNTRSGWCRVSGADADLAAFVGGLGLAPAPDEPVYGEDTCLVFPEFGVDEHDTLHPAAGVVAYEPSGPLPKNTDNVVLRRVYVASGQACLEYEYPYG